MFARLGAVAFAASLAYLVYFYLVVLASTTGGGTSLVAASLCNAALFAVFALHHSLFARTSFKQRVRRLVADRERSVYVWVASALLFGVCLLWQPIAGLVYDVTGPWRGALWALQIGGVLLTVRSAAIINPRELAGLPHDEGGSSGTGLLAAGPYRWVRHPIYLGWMLMVFGAPRMTANRLLFAVLSSVYLILAIPLEERSLVEAHGDRYRAYRRMVRWRVLPGLW